MEIELGLQGISFESQNLLFINCKENLLQNENVAYFVCFDKILVEFKALDRDYGKEESQVLNCLKATGLCVGLLINFVSCGSSDWKRFVN